MSDTMSGVFRWHAGCGLGSGRRARMTAVSESTIAALRTWRGVFRGISSQSLWAFAVHGLLIIGIVLLHQDVLEVLAAAADHDEIFARWNAGYGLVGSGSQVVAFIRSAPCNAGTTCSHTVIHELDVSA